jgi:hypothetical protein
MAMIVVVCGKIEKRRTPRWTRRGEGRELVVVVEEIMG